MERTGKSICCGAAVFALFTMLRNYIHVSNMVFFVMMCSVFGVVTLCTYICQDKIEWKENSRIKRAWAVLPVISLAIWMILFYVNETEAGQPLDKEALIRSYFPFPVWLLITAAGTGICLWILSKSRDNRLTGYRKAMRVVVSVLFSAAAAVQFYAPNIFQDIQGGTFHSHAYTNSIINVCWLIPYSEHMQAMYGHYAILYMPVLKVMHSLFQLDYLTGIFLVTAVIAGISILLYSWILNFFVKNDLIFYLALFAVGERYFMLMQGGVYMQVHPHRMIFPILLTALALWEYKKQKEYHLIAIGIIALSVVWSTEVGLVMMAAFALYRWVQHIMDGKKFTWKKCCLFLRELFLFAIVPFAAAYIIVNGYNIFVGGALLDLEEFVYPLISERGYISQVELPLPDVTHAWIGASVLFLSPVCLSMLAVLFPTEKKNTKWMPFYFLLGVMSLGLMIYYINRPVEGSLFIIMFLMLILQVIILQRAQDEYLVWKENKEQIFNQDNRFWFLSIRVITTLILFVMAFDSIYSMPGAWKTSRETIWKRAELQEFMDYIYEQVPPDAVAFGEGVPEMLSMIDRDTHLHTTEWSYTNTPLDTMKKVRYDLEDEKWIFCSLYSLWLMQEEFPGLTDNYELHEIFEYNGAQFGFFIKNE